MIGKRYPLVLFFAVFTLFLTYKANGAVPGDADGSGKVDLKDSTIVLQLNAGKIPSSNIFLEADVNNDERLGVVEAIFDLQSLLPDYNKDGSNVRVFLDGNVNDYVKIQERLSTQILRS